jgi:hypothetical protein
MGLMAVGIVFNFTLLVPLIGQVALQSSEGQAARDRQQAVYPVSLKLYVDAARRGVISASELDCFRVSSRCPGTP